MKTFLIINSIYLTSIFNQFETILGIFFGREPFFLILEFGLFNAISHETTDLQSFVYHFIGTLMLLHENVKKNFIIFTLSRVTAV